MKKTYEEKCQLYFDKKKSIYSSLLTFLENEDDKNDENYDNLIKCIEKQKIVKKCEKLKNFLYLISKVSNNHYRVANLFDKIKRILIFLKSDIKRKLKNTELFYIFVSNKLILLFLFDLIQVVQIALLDHQDIQAIASLKLLASDQLQLPIY